MSRRVLNEFLEQFVIEGRELVEQATTDLLALEEAADDQARLDSAFRGFHTLKGAAGIVEFLAMGRVMHAAEELLAAVRAGGQPVTADLVSDGLACLDQVAQWLDAIEAQGDLPAVPAEEVEGLIARFTPSAIADAAAMAAEVPDWVGKLVADHPELRGATRLVLRYTPDPECFFRGEDPLDLVLRLPGLLALDLAPRAPWPPLEAFDPFACNLVISALTGGTPEEAAEVLREVLDQVRMYPVAPAPTPRGTVNVARSLRVDVGRIDALVNLAGELTVAKNAIGTTARHAQHRPDAHLLAQRLRDQHALLDRLVGELRRAVLDIRVLPLGHVFRRFPKLVREMAQSLGKSVRLVIEGEATEADKAVVEALFEPILHVVRNALDHGVEDAGTRREGGKPSIATLGLRAARDGEHVVVDVTDDGRGLDLTAIREVAARRGLATTEALAGMADQAVADLIFAPGFSTARVVTDVSGRGVGMDAVRSSIARLGGRVAVGNRPAGGTLVRFTLPFTVMMSRVMTVDAGGQVFGIPFETVVETVRMPRERITRIGAAEAFVLRDRTVPLIALADALAIAPNGCRRERDAKIVVATVAGDLGGVEVDGFGEPLDVMLKPMEGLLAGMPGIAGTTLLGDGRVLIVLALEELLQ